MSTPAAHSLDWLVRTLDVWVWAFALDGYPAYAARRFYVRRTARSWAVIPRCSPCAAPGVQP